MSLAWRIAIAITLATAFSVGLAGVLAREALHSYLAPFAQHFATMQRTLGWGPDLQTVHGLIDRSLLVALLFGILLALLVGTFIGRGLARSVIVVRNGFARYAEGKLEERIALAGPAEIESIAASANRMAERLHAAQYSERELIAGIAHDLAHPLTAIRGTVEAARDGLIDVSSPDALKRILSGISELDEAVCDLRDVAAAEVGALRLHVDSVNLRQLVERMGAMYADLAMRRGVRFEANAADVSVRTDEQRLGRVLANLLVNALQATPPGGRVLVAALPEAANAVLRIENTAGPQVAERIRSALAGGAEAGLGLRVVRLLSQALHATVSVCDCANGAIVEVRLQS
jgi:two-component system sensor histidine kinase BaeS